MRRPLGYNREQRAKRDRVAFADLLASPQTGAITFPANARAYARSVAGSAEGDVAATFNGRTVRTPDLAAGQRSFIGYVERGTVLTPGPGVEIQIDMGAGRYSVIGSSGPADPILGTITIGKEPTSDIYGYSAGEYGTVLADPFAIFPLSFFRIDTDGFIEFAFEGNCVSLIENKAVDINSNLSFIMDPSYESGTNLTYGFVQTQFLPTIASVGTNVTFEIISVTFDPADWGIGTMTVGFDLANSAYGFGNSSGAMVQPNSTIPLELFLSFDLATDVYSIQILAVNVVPLFTGATLEIDGNTETLIGLSFSNNITSIAFTCTTLLTATDLAREIPFSFNFA